MLKKIEYYWNKNHELIDISDLKIYWDTVENVFRRKFYCKDCKKQLRCYCFGHLNLVIDSIKYGYQCNKCFILSTWNDKEEYAIDVAECVDKRHPNPGDFKNRVKMMQLLNNQDGNFENSEISKKCEEIANMIYEELFNELELLPDEDFNYIGYDMDDYEDDGGYNCEL